MRLLVSVTEPVEVGAAVAGGAEIIDVKDPTAGPLGAPAPDVVRRVRAAVAPPQLLSVALGDTAAPSHEITSAGLRAAALKADFVKVALTGPRRGARALLNDLVHRVRQVNGTTHVVAVVYADVHPNGGLEPLELPGLARAAGAHVAMLDTACKNGTSLLGHLQESELLSFARSARRLGLRVALAGSLGPEQIPRLSRVAPDVVGVRGAACVGGRRGRVDRARVYELSRLVLSQSGPPGVTTSQASPAGNASGK